MKTVNRASGHRRSAKALALAGIGVLAASLGTAVGAAPALASDTTQCQNAGAPPTANAWYDQDLNYKGTRLVYREDYPNSAVAMQSTRIFETFGQGYWQVEVWDLRSNQNHLRVSCQRVPSEPTKEPGNPQVVEGGPGVGGGVHLPFRSVTIFPSIPYTGKVTVGEMESVE